MSRKSGFWEHGNWFFQFRDSSETRSLCISAEIVRFKIPWNFLTVNINLPFWQLTVKKTFLDGWRLISRPFARLMVNPTETLFHIPERWKEHPFSGEASPAIIGRIPKGWGQPITENWPLSRYWGLFGKFCEWFGERCPRLQIPMLEGRIFQATWLLI